VLCCVLLQWFVLDVRDPALQPHEMSSCLESLIDNILKPLGL